MCAVLSPILSCPLSGEKFAFSSRQSRASMRCLCRPGRACFFLFCFSPVSLSHFSPNGDNAVFPHLGIAAAPGFVHNWLTLAQQGLFGSSLVCRPHPPPNQPKIAAQGRVWFLPRTNLPLPLKGERLDFAQLGGLRVRNAEKPGAFPQEKTDTSYPRASLGSCLGNCCSHRFNGAGNPFRWCRSPTWPAKSHTEPHRAEFGFRLLTGASHED